jgi:hypothetical protein
MKLTLTLAFAVATLFNASLALAQAPSAQAPSAPAPPSVVKVLAIGTVAPSATPEVTRGFFPKEAYDTLNLYLAGTIEQWWARQDGNGVVFLLNTRNVEEAKRALDELPLVKGKILSFDFIPVGPLTPLRTLIPANPATTPVK